MDNCLSEETKQEIIECLIRKIDALKEDKRALYTVIDESQQTINKLKQTINKQSFTFKSVEEIK